jgi:hypothetical protein
MDRENRLDRLVPRFAICAVTVGYFSRQLKSFTNQGKEEGMQTHV